MSDRGLGCPPGGEARASEPIGQPGKVRRAPVRRAPVLPTAEGSPFSKIQHPKKRAFLVAYAETGRKGPAAKLAGVDRSAIYQPGWRDDPLFQEGLKLAHAMSCNILEDEVFRRAVEGVEKPTGWYKGRPGGYVREQSDLLLMFRLKAEMPGKYGDKVDVRVLLAGLDLNRCSDEQIARLAAGEHPLSVFGSTAAVAALQAPAPDRQKPPRKATNRQ